MRVLKGIPILLACPLLVLLVWSLPARPIHDEAVHFAQAQMFARGEWAFHPAASIWPIVHLLIAGVLSVVGVDALHAARALIAGSALVAWGAFHGIAAHTDRRTAGMKTAQVAFLPVLLPYCVLVYTDVPALAALLCSFYAILKRRPVLFCVASLLAVAMRQSNITWLIAAWALYLYLAETGESRRTLRAVSVGCALIVVAWIAGVAVLGGVAVAAGSAHPHVLSVRGLPNIEAAIGLGAVLFAPLFVAVLRRDGGSRRRLVELAAAAAVAALVASTFHVEHPYNTMPNLIAPYLRNRLLFEITHSGVAKLLFSAWVGVAAIGFARFPFVTGLEELKLPLYLVAALSLLPFELIEQRYDLPFLVLFAALRRPQSDRVEWAQLALNVVLSIAVFYGLLRGGVFL